MNSLHLSSSLLNSASNPIYISKALGVKEYAFCDEMNPSFRNTMEDGTKKLLIEAYVKIPFRTFYR